MSERRKLKPINQRKPEKSFSQSEIAEEICKETGFTRKDVLLVLQQYGKIAREKLCSGSKVYFSGIGTMFPIVKVSRYSFVLQYKYGGDGMTEPQYVPKMHFCKPLKNKLKEVEISEELINEQYAEEN